MHSSHHGTVAGFTVQSSRHATVGTVGLSTESELPIGRVPIGSNRDHSAQFRVLALAAEVAMIRLTFQRAARLTFRQ